tara:strand:- start:215 stop:1069 length:855 start_codon:yes stop_codon:yes gene_type:complete
MKALTCIPILLLGIFPHADAASKQPLSDMDALKLFNQASILYEEASQLSSEESKMAMNLYREAAALYISILDRGFQHPDIYYNLGNTHYKLYDLGKAILNYRRAQKFMPGDPDLRQNILSAKSKILDDEPDRSPPALLQTLLFWHYDSSLDLLAKLAFVAYLLFCVTLCLRIYFKSVLPRWVISLTFWPFIVLTASFAVRYHEANTVKMAVVVADSVSVRAGYSDREIERFPVHAGTELLVEEIKDITSDERWLKIALDKDLRGWIRNNAVEIIKQPQSPPDAE